MQRENLYILFGECYKKGDYGKMVKVFRDDIIYDAFDCMYKFQGANDVLKVLLDDAKKTSQIHYGYYRHKGIFISHLTECMLVCDKITLECKKIICFKTRFGKVQCIKGLNPKKYKFTRGTII